MSKNHPAQAFFLNGTYQREASTVLEHKPVADLVFLRSKYGSDNNRALKMKDSNEKYKSFVTCDPKREKFLQNPDNVRKYLYQELKDVIPNSCFIEMMEGTRKNKQTESTTVLSPGIKESAQSFQIDNSVTNLENIKMFTKNLVK